MNDADKARAAFDAAAELHRRAAQSLAEPVARAARMLRDALTAGRQVLVFGNGGSATDAQHFAAELVGRFLRERRAVPVIALTTDTAVITAVANDFGYDAVFARQLDALGRSGDIAIGITTSGQSASVNLALEHARARGLQTIGLTGRDGGATGPLVDLHLNVASDSTARIQEVHRTMLHAICELVEASL